MPESKNLPSWTIQSAVAGVVWPALPLPAAAEGLGLLFQLEQSQWLPPARLRANQLAQLEALTRHAHASVPYYRSRWGGAYDPHAPLSWDAFARLPTLSRRDLREHAAELKSATAAGPHAAVHESITSGSSGAPVRVWQSAVTQLFWNVFTLREHLWHRRDLGKKLAILRKAQPGEFDNWGPATSGLVRTGRCAMKGLGEPIEALWDWLAEQRADYLLTYPSILLELARIAALRGSLLPGLIEARTFGEMLTADARAYCSETLGVPVVDVYSAIETGYLALQCPSYEGYHVQSEGVVLEVLDERGNQVPAGSVGRVVVTCLHNLASPLIRYEIDDFAEAGELCACGRGLPVLRRIIGRVRNTLVTASGERYWPTFAVREMCRVAPPLRQYQFAQTSSDRVEGRLVVARRLTPDEEEGLRRLVRSRLPPGIRVELEYREAIARGAGGKYEDFVCELAPAGAR